MMGSNEGLLLKANSLLDDVIHNLKEARVAEHADEFPNQDKARSISLAITEAETAQLWLTKAL